ncbi:MAG: alkaline phosphatase family protein [Candidatus Bipolaricaulota bacterium]|nr:alkaline phosphatase family protein [Candidatus Bipolaricaulota bacterium]
MSADKELLIFGLDGATFDLLDPWFDRDELPFLEKLINEGVRGEMTSTIPPLTGPAWSTFQTGVNPGKHGVFDWGSSGNDTYGEGMVDSTSIEAKTLWELASEAGKKVGVIGVPVTYPPRKVNGFMTSGVLTPKEAEDYVYPPSLKEEIEKVVETYRFAPTHAEMALNNEQWIEDLKGSITNREEVARHLLSTREWDVSMVYFMETDTVKHHLFHQNSPLGKDGNAVDEDPVLEVYKRVEKAVKNIYDSSAGKDTHVMIVSDHGFGPLKWIFNVNSWLIQKGYMKLKDSAGVRIKRSASKLGLNQKNLYKIGDLLGPLAKGNEWEMEGFNDILGKMFLSLNDVDWENTKAYSRGGVTGAIRLNIKGREKHGCITPEDAPGVQKDLMRDLKELRNPHTGENVIAEVMRNEEVYEGPRSLRGPDILFLTKDLETDTGGLTVFKTMDRIIPSFAITGTHRMNGVFAGYGPKYLRKSEVEGLNISDPAPISLHTLGLKIPSYMDGSPRREVFSEEFWSEHQPELSELNLPGTGEGKTNNEHDEEIKERLEGLGYLA